eukprot:TRINITY_DN23761_c0_g1_i1.p1 TRINITY_DN23761_c0_g1~~TRINITY_DN23761_c0_g1_i1.p1  ORF type:complete len:211 (-),score=47.70 TRINITY_DN23761_c0_g1_i1:254-886(-)
MKAALSSLRRICERLEKLIVDNTPTAPGVVVRPSLLSLQQVRADIAATAAEASVAVRSPEVLAELEALEKRLETFLTNFEAQAFQEPAPWGNPTALNTLRQVETSLAGEVKAFKALCRRQPGLRGPQAQRELPWWDPVAYNNKVLEEVDAIHALLGPPGQELVPCWSTLHAAGTAATTAFVDHSPSAFEYVFAPKAQAAWTLHEHRALHP